MRKGRGAPIVYPPVGHDGRRNQIQVLVWTEGEQMICQVERVLLSHIAALKAAKIIRSTCGYAADSPLSKSKFLWSTSIVWQARATDLWETSMIYGYVLIQHYQKVSFIVG
jgi:hypothetical protein